MEKVPGTASKKRANDEMADKLLKSLLENDKQKTLSQIADLIKKEGIGEIILHAQEAKEPAPGKSLTLKPDLDARGALLFFELINEKIGGIYKNGSATSFIPKSGNNESLKTEKDSPYKIGKIPNSKKEGLKIFIDTGGEWLKIVKNGETIVYLDHHGSGKKDDTSATKMAMELYSKIEEDKKIPEWLENFEKAITSVDNLSYINEINKTEKNNGGFDKKYFTEKWPYS